MFGCKLEGHQRMIDAKSERLPSSAWAKQEKAQNRSLRNSKICFPTARRRGHRENALRATTEV